MKLSECKHGRLVVDDGSYKIGMVVGLCENSFNHAIPVIQWQDGTTKAYHPSKLSLYEE